MLAKQLKNPAQNRASKSKTFWSSRWSWESIFGYIDGTTIELTISCKSNTDWLTIGNMLQKILIH